MEIGTFVWEAAKGLVRPDSPVLRGGDFWSSKFLLFRLRIVTNSSPGGSTHLQN